MNIVGFRSRKKQLVVETVGCKLTQGTGALRLCDREGSEIVVGEGLTHYCDSRMGTMVDAALD